MKESFKSSVPDACLPRTADQRVLESFTRRFHAAYEQASLGAPPHATNGDETRYEDKCGTYSKALRQVRPGVVDRAVYRKFRDALDRGRFEEFEELEPGGSRTLNGPMGSYAFNFLGADPSQFGDAASPDDMVRPLPVVPPAPALASDEYATELMELYWCSLLRDVGFSEYAGSPIAQEAAAELSRQPSYKGPTQHGTVTPDLLFRGRYPGEEIGPYVSQLFVTPTMLGAQAFDQRYVTYQAGVDYMTEPAEWADVQNGIDTGRQVVTDPTPRYLHNGRGLAAFTHVDELFQAYFTAYLVLRSLNSPVNPGNPYVRSKTQNGFGTFGPPDFAAVLAEVAKIALNSVWYQKWVVHLRHRPESGGGLVDLIHKGETFDGSPADLVFKSKALERSFGRYGTYLLSQAFPEGSPAHPAYPTGHGTVGGACITVLKFFFDGAFVFEKPRMPTREGTGLRDWTGGPAEGGRGPLTVNGELHKLAHNVTFGHGLHGGIHWRSDSDVSMRLGEAVAIRYLRDLARTYREPFEVRFTRLDGATETIRNP